MNRLIGLMPLFVAALWLSACDKPREAHKPVAGIEQPIAGSWFEGQWRAEPPSTSNPNLLTISAEGLRWGDCKATGDGQVSINGKQATYAVTGGFDCISRTAKLTGLVLTQRSDCELQLEAYASDVEIENGTPTISGQLSQGRLYTLAVGHVMVWSTQIVTTFMRNLSSG
ncbi:hypothetical protein [Pseudomonas aeruginosa]|uniref:hypothetical protein n=1 Tax=Pseudomonas aeruginosa TaxID=287 RepID=UPI00197BFBD1|nr:hypothetical protein [Pseudomonas aeruginosa]